MFESRGILLGMDAGTYGSDSPELHTSDGIYQSMNEN